MGIKDFTPRLYQQTIFATCATHNTLVALPTGLGKTAISVMLASQRLKQYPEKKIIVLAPTRPLIDQHKKTFEKYLDFSSENMLILSGFTAPEVRAKLWEQGQIFFTTPQTVQNDVISGKLDLKNVSMICFDEAHRATGDYAYVYIANQYMKQADFPRILALTASPGSDMDKIKEIISNLFIEKIEVRTDSDKDVVAYVKGINTEWVEVELPPEIKIVHKYLKASFKSKLEEAKKHGYVDRTDYLTKKDLLGIQAALQGQIAQGERDFEILKTVSLVAEAIKVEHAVELIETQGLSPLIEYFEKVFSDGRTSKTKAVQNLCKDINFKSAYIKAKQFNENIEHPKLVKLKRILQYELDNKPNAKIIVFSHFRDTASKIVEEINQIDGVKASIFVGQQKKKGKGMSQKEQIQAIEDFRQGKYNILLSTSVGEEGLDIPQVDLVIFYEPVPSAIRKIQRRGRTGRLEKGRVIVLVAKDTRDVGYRWAAHHREGRMYKNLKKIRDEAFQPRKVDLTDFIPKEEKLKIYADAREKGSKIIEKMADQGFNVQLSRLDMGDYILSKNVGVEFKTKKDFVDSLVDGRLLSQIRMLKQNYQKPLLIVEGEEDIYSIRNIHPNALRGLIATIISDYGIPLLYTKDSNETAAIMSAIAKREQEQSDKEYSPHTIKPKTDNELQEYIVSSFPNIGGSLAKELLKKFKSIKQILNADIGQLQEINKIGQKKAAEIKRILEREYEN